MLRSENQGTWVKYGENKFKVSYDADKSNLNWTQEKPREPSHELWAAC